MKLSYGSKRSNPLDYKGVIISVVILLLLFISYLAAQRIVTYKTRASSELYVTELPKLLKLSNNLGAYTEIPPWILTTGYKQLNLTTSFTYDCATPENILTDTISFTSANCFASLKSDDLNYSPTEMPTNQDWKRNYNGIFTQHAIRVDGRLRLLAIDHGENKNLNNNGKLYQNTLNPGVLVQNCASVCTNGMCQDCFPSYHAFVNMSWQYLDDAHGYGMRDQIEEGPIVWPQDGFYTNGTRVSYGTANPHGFIDGDYIYVFYSEMALQNAGVRVARAAVSTGGLPGNFQTYCNGSWVNSLPANFDKNRIKDFINVKGGCSSPIIPSDTWNVSFAVAKKTDGGYFGIQESSNGITTAAAKLYTSQDLIHWTFLQDLYSTGKYADSIMHYPIFLNKEGTSNEVINPNDFYIVGASVGKVYAIEVRPRLSSTPVPTPTPTQAVALNPISVYQLLYPALNRVMWTANETEKANALKGGWQLIKVAFHAWNAQSGSLKAVYRLRNLNSNNYFFSTNDVEIKTLSAQNWGSEGVGFYAYSSNLPGLVPVYRLSIKKPVWNYIFATSESDVQNAISLGYVNEGVAFYALP